MSRHALPRRAGAGRPATPSRQRRADATPTRRADRRHVARRSRHTSWGRRSAAPALLALASCLALGGLAEASGQAPSPAPPVGLTPAGTTLLAAAAPGTTPPTGVATRFLGAAPGPSDLPAPRRASRARPTGPQWVRPAGGPLTSPFGPRWGRLHAGIDLGAEYGSPIVAAGAGVVVFSGMQGGYGNVVEVRHDDGTVTVYGHQSALSVKVGQAVRAGQKLGRVGSTGHSTGPHLHFEVRPDGTKAVDPLPWLRAHGIKV